MRTLHHWRMRPARPSSAQRKALRIAVVEGVPAMIIANLLGGPILTAYLLYLGANSVQVGLVMAIPPLANLAQIAVAYGMQRMTNRRRYLVIFSVLHRLLWVSTGLIPFLVPEGSRIPVFIVMFGLSFMLASSTGVIWSSLVGDIVPAQVRGRYFGIRNTIHWAVASLSLLIGGQLLERLPEGRGFVWLFAISAVCVIWNGIYLYKYPNPPFQKSEEAGSLGLFLKPLRDGQFLQATLFLSLFVFIQNIAIPLFPFVMLDILGVSYWEVTVITTVQMLVMMVSYYYWGNLNARYPTKTLLMWTLPVLALSCLGWGLLAFLPVLTLLAGVHVLLGIGLGGYNLLAFNFMIGDTPKANRPMYIAMFSALTGVAGFVGPMIGGQLYKQLAGGPEWVLSYGISLYTGVLLLVLALGAGPLVLKARKR